MKRFAIFVAYISATRSQKTCYDIKKSYNQESCCGNPTASLEPVRITGALVGTDADYFRAMLKPLIDTTGVAVEYKGSPDFETEIQEQLNGNFTRGPLPDIALWPQPGAVVAAANTGKTVPLKDLGVNMTKYQSEYSPYLTNLGRGNDNELHGGASAANLKSLIWYQPSVFESHGYSVPTTWDELMTLANDIVAAGLTPFCEAVYSNGATGWVGTDWMEDIILRTGGGIATYDAWVTHQIPFNHSEIVAALERWGTIVKNDSYIAGGSASVMTTYFGNGAIPMFQRDANGNPGCFMYKQASFISMFFIMSVMNWQTGQVDPSSLALM